MTSTTPQSRAPSRQGWPLWASAAVLAGLLIFQLGRPPAAPVALAGNVSEIGDLTALTADAGGTEDILAILDRRAESLLIYSATRTSFELLQAYDLKTVFARARAAVSR